MTQRFLTGILLVLLLAGVCVSAAAREAGETKVTVLFSGQTHGDLEPCA